MQPSTLPPPRTIAAAILLAAVALPACTARGDAPAILLTADGEGHVTPCAACPHGAGQGGLSRRATLLARLRAQGPVLLVDAGNSLFGADSAASGGRVIVAAYDALGYDAVNVSFRDFRHGRAATVDLLQRAKFVTLSANVLDEQSGEPLFRPYVVKQLAGRRVAVIGLTDVPPELDLLPHLREQLAGVRVRPPAEAVDEWLPKARAEADAVVVVYYGRGLPALRAKLAGTGAVVLAGGVRPAEVGAAADVTVAAAEPHGRSVAVVVPGAGRPGLAQELVTADLAADAKTAALLASYDGAGAAAVAVTPEKPGQSATGTMPNEAPAEPDASGTLRPLFGRGNPAAPINPSAPDRAAPGAPRVGPPATPPATPATAPTNVLAKEPPEQAREAPARPKFCSHCGASLKAAAKFCTNCGTRIAP